MGGGRIIAVASGVVSELLTTKVTHFETMKGIPYFSVKKATKTGTGVLLS